MGTVRQTVVCYATTIGVFEMSAANASPGQWGAHVYTHVAPPSPRARGGPTPLAVALLGI